jgi:hypothetical protein
MANSKSIPDRIEKILDININSTVNDLIDCVKDAEEIGKAIESRISSNYTLHRFTSVSDWDHWQESYENNEFQMQICFFHNHIVPPRHSVQLNCGPNEKIQRIQILYGYYFDHLFILDLPIDSALIPLLKYTKSLSMFIFCDLAVEKKKNSLAKVPFFGNLIANFYFSPWSGSSLEQIKHSIEYKSTRIMYELEEWLDKFMSDEDRQSKKSAYDKYFEGVPEEARGFFIQM